MKTKADEMKFLADEIRDDAMHGNNRRELPYSKGLATLLDVVAERVKIEGNGRTRYTGKMLDPRCQRLTTWGIVLVFKSEGAQ